MAGDILEKVCPTCKLQRAATEFYRHPRTRDGLSTQCKSCRREYARTAKPRSSQHAYYLGHKDTYRKTPTELREHKLQTRYGMSHADYVAMLDKQGGCCGICGTDNPGGRWIRFHVDHCHETGMVRGLLCHKCNHGLGQFGDSLEGILKAVAYLRGE